MSVTETARHVERVVGTGSATFDEVRSRVESLRRLGEPALLVPSRVAMVRTDEVMVAESPSNKDTLRAIVDVRGALRVGECVWWGMAVAQALSALHRHGLAHGALDADAVIVAHDRVALTRLVDGHSDDAPADDIAALGRLLASVVREADADRLRAWTEPMTHRDPAGRPTAAMVARALSSCAPPEVLRQQPVGVATALRRAATAGGRPGERAAAIRLEEARWWRARLTVTAWVRRAGVVVLAVALVVGTVVAGERLVGRGAGGIGAGGIGAATVAEPSEAASGATPVDAARELTLARFSALSGSDGDALIALTLEGSPARADAQNMAEALAAGSMRVERLGGIVESADLVRQGAENLESAVTVIRVRYRLGPHVVVLEGTRVDYEGYAQTVDLALEWDEARGWLVRDAVQVDTAEDGAGAVPGPGESNADTR